MALCAYRPKPECHGNSRCTTIKAAWAMVKGPEWLADEACWPEAPDLIETEQAAEEAIPRRKEQLLMEQDKGNSDCSKWLSGLMS